MFTGIIEETGMVEAITRSAALWRIAVRGPLVSRDSKPGDSIAVDGICFTVTEITGGAVFSFQASGETRSRSTMEHWRTGTRVNLERALTLQTRLGGHLVQGHIDARGKLVRSDVTGSSAELAFRFPPEWRKYLAEKGSVAVDGVSLTVAGLSPGTFSVAVIPHTLALTTLSVKKPGDEVNLEFDVIAKYTESLIGFRSDDGNKLSAAYLRERGFIQ